jgi:hypothetical protein
MISLAYERLVIVQQFIRTILARETRFYCSRNQRASEIVFKWVKIRVSYAFFELGEKLCCIRGGRFAVIQQKRSVSETLEDGRWRDRGPERWQSS